VGRFGAIAGPLAAGTLLAAGIEIGHLFWLAIVPTLVCAIAVTLLRVTVVRSGETAAVAATASPHL
jgi:hypothetical protein